MQKDAYRYPSLGFVTPFGTSPQAALEVRRAMLRAIACLDGTQDACTASALVDLRVVLEHHDRSLSAQPYLDQTEGTVG
jgi:hypothetical protein